MKTWWRCASQGHRPTVWVGWLMPHKAIVRCYCGRGIRPQFVPLDLDGVSVARQSPSTAQQRTVPTTPEQP